MEREVLAMVWAVTKFSGIDGPNYDKYRLPVVKVVNESKIIIWAIISTESSGV